MAAIYKAAAARLCQCVSLPSGSPLGRVAISVATLLIFQSLTRADTVIDPTTVLGMHFTTTGIAQTPGGPIPIAPAPTYAGTGYLGTEGYQTGTYFNNIVLGDTDARATKTFSDRTINGLLASDGTTATGVTVTLGAVDGFTTSLLPDSANAPLLDSYAFADTRGTFAIHGLVAGDLYTLYVFSQNGSASNSTTNFVVNGLDETITDISPAPNTLSMSFDPATQSYVGNTLGFSVYADSTGSISGSFSSNVTDAATFNGFQLVGDLSPASAAAPLPSPAYAGLGLLGAFGLLTLARRRGWGKGRLDATPGSR